MTRIVFIYGVLKRSGTNLLNQILLAYPNLVEPILKIRENCFLENSDLLYAYANQLFRTWSHHRWEGSEFSREALFSDIGDALTAYIARGIDDLPNKILLSKTPSVKHLERNFEMFPSSRIIIIIRDPRDIAASAFRTWKRPVKLTVEQWNKAFATIAHFEKSAPSEDYILIRYEDLLNNRTECIRSVLNAMRLDVADFPWAELEKMPVLGSSELGWGAHPAPADFQPIGRWKALPSNERRQFDCIEASSLHYFGYTKEGASQELPSRKERIDYNIQPGSQASSGSTRAMKLRQALRLTIEATLGETAATYARKKFSDLASLG